MLTSTYVSMSVMQAELKVGERERDRQLPSPGLKSSLVPFSVCLPELNLRADSSMVD